MAKQDSDMMVIEVEPPAQATAGIVLYPPVVASSDSNAEFDWVEITVMDVHGQPYEGVLNGTLSTNGATLDNESSSSSSAHVKKYFAFPDLSIAYAGTYTLRICAVRMDYSSPDEVGAEIVGEAVTTQTITVYDQAVTMGPPSSTERRLLRKLRDSRQFGVPRAPH